MEEYNEVEILVAEDNPRDAELTIRALKKNKLGYNAYIAEDGEKAVNFLLCREQFSSRSFINPLRLVLLDLKLPKLSGLEVLRKIKSDIRTKHLPIVIVTSSNEEQDIQEAYKLGANSYVVKPIEFDKFVNTISSLGIYWLLVNEPFK